MSQASEQQLQSQVAEAINRLSQEGRGPPELNERAIKFNRLRVEPLTDVDLGPLIPGVNDTDWSKYREVNVGGGDQQRADDYDEIKSQGLKANLLEHYASSDALAVLKQQLWGWTLRQHEELRDFLDDKFNAFGEPASDTVMQELDDLAANYRYVFDFGCPLQWVRLEPTTYSDVGPTHCLALPLMVRVRQAFLRGQAVALDPEPAHIANPVPPCCDLRRPRAGEVGRRGQVPAGRRQEPDDPDLRALAVQPQVHTGPGP